MVLSVTTVLVSRFLLDLQASNQRALKVGTDDPLYMGSTLSSAGRQGSVVFARVVGSLGSAVSSSIEYGTEVDDEDSVSTVAEVKCLDSDGESHD